MPKTSSKRLLEHYPPLRDIETDDEWDDIFHRQGRPWEAEEDDYIREWYGKEATINIAYSLGRCPWSIQSRAAWIGVLQPRSGSGRNSRTEEFEEVVLMVGGAAIALLVLGSLGSVNSFV